VAKGFASGMPLGAIVAREKIMNWPPGSHASTFGGNPVACAASLATLDLLEGGLIDNAKVVGDYLIERLREVQAEFPAIGEVRGVGLMAAADFVADPESRRYDSETRNRVVQECFRRGVLVLGCGESAVRFCPALTISEKQIDAAMAVFRDAVATAVKS